MVGSAGLRKARRRQNPRLLALNGLRAALQDRQFREGGPEAMIGDRDNIGRLVARLAASTEVQIEPAAQQPFGKMRQAIERILHGRAEQPAAHQIVVRRDAQVEFPLHRRRVAVEIKAGLLLRGSEFRPDVANSRPAA